MKNSLIIFLFFSLITSCNKTDKLRVLENRITSLENQNKLLVNSLNAVDTEFIKPFKVYEKIVLSELKNSPNQIISEYEFLIKDYPNSLWKHEAKKRIENIERRKKYWTKKNGWKLPKKSKKTKSLKIIEPMAISCPGC